MLAAIRRASSLLSGLTADRRPRLILEYTEVWHDEEVACRALFGPSPLTRRQALIAFGSGAGRRV